MSDFLIEVVTVAQELGININLLNQQKSQESIKKILHKYTNSNLYKFPLWENLKDTLSFRNEQGWTLLKKLFPESPKYLFFEPDESRTLLEFSNSDELVLLLENTFHFVFYITNIDLDYVVCFNDHDYLICTGSAKSLVEVG